VKLRDRLKADFNQAAHSCKYSQDELDHAKRPLLQAVSARIADEIESLEAKAADLRDRIRGMSKSAAGGIDDLSLRASQMVRGWAPPPPADPQLNSARYRTMLAWADAYKAWRNALQADPNAPPPEAANILKKLQLHPRQG
jgi:hypothetical protein